jgi:hypothetical protein
MAYDEDLANRIRELIAAEEGVTERRCSEGSPSSSAGTCRWPPAARAACSCASIRRVRRAPGQAARRPDGDAGPHDGRLAAGRPRWRAHEAPARALGAGAASPTRDRCLRRAERGAPPQRTATRAIVVSDW